MNKKYRVTIIFLMLLSLQQPAYPSVSGPQKANIHIIDSRQGQAAIIHGGQSAIYFKTDDLRTGDTLTQKTINEIRPRQITIFFKAVPLYCGGEVSVPDSSPFVTFQYLCGANSGDWCTSVSASSFAVSDSSKLTAELNVDHEGTILVKINRLSATGVTPPAFCD